MENKLALESHTAKLAVRNDMFEKRFTAFYKNTNPLYQLPPKDPVAIAVLRLSLGDSFFSPGEIALTQKLVERYKVLSARFPNFPIIIGKRGMVPEVFLGGDQGWFETLGEHKAGAFGGCGPVAATNILAAAAWRNTTAAENLGFKQWHDTKASTQFEYLSFMNKVYKTVKPFEPPFGAKVGFHSAGIISKAYHNHRTLKFARKHGMHLATTKYSKSFFTGSYNNESIKEALGRGEYMCFLSGLTRYHLYYPNGRRASDKFSTHWVNIVGYTDDTFILSSWGREYHVYIKDINRWNLFGFVNSIRSYSLNPIT